MIKTALTDMRDLSEGLRKFSKDTLILFILQNSFVFLVRSKNLLEEVQKTEYDRLMELNQKAIDELLEESKQTRLPKNATPEEFIEYAKRSKDQSDKFERLWKQGERLMRLRYPESFKKDDPAT